MTTPATKLGRVDALMLRGIAWPVPEQAVRMIALEEDCRLVPYRCTAGVWTCGWGETSGVTPGVNWTQEYADGRFQQSLDKWGNAVRSMLANGANDNQFSAMLCLAYNIGLAGFKKSTVLKRHNAGDFDAASRAFSLWNRAGGKESPGLTARRARESALYLYPVDANEQTLSPQRVDPESPITSSPIVKSGAATAATGAIAAIGSVANQAQEATGAMEGVNSAFRTAADMVQNILGIPMPVILGVVLLVAGYMAVKWRVKQRSGGWA